MIGLDHGSLGPDPTAPSQPDRGDEIVKIQSHGNCPLSTKRVAAVRRSQSLCACSRRRGGCRTAKRERGMACQHHNSALQQSPTWSIYVSAAKREQDMAWHGPIPRRAGHGGKCQCEAGSKGRHAGASTAGGAIACACSHGRVRSAVPQRIAADELSAEQLWAVAAIAIGATSVRSAAEVLHAHRCCTTSAFSAPFYAVSVPLERRSGALVLFSSSSTRFSALSSSCLL